MVWSGGAGFEGGEGEEPPSVLSSGLRTDPTLGGRSEGAGSVSTLAPGALSGVRAPAPLPGDLLSATPHLVPHFS